MGSPAALSLTRAEMERTLGVLFIGYVFASVIYGLNLFQTWKYSSVYSSDPIALKSFVATVCLLDLGGVALVSHALYIYLIQMFPKTIGLIGITTTFNAEILLAVFSTFLIQSYYAYRLWTVHKKPSVAVILAIIASGALALGMARTVNVAQNQEFQVLGLLPVRLQIAFRQALVLFAGLILTIMQWRIPMQRAATNDSEEQDWCDKLFIYVVTRFTIANVTQLVYLVVFAALPRTAYWLPFHLCSQKLYVNAFLSEINNRPVSRGRHKGSSGGTATSRSFVNPGARKNCSTQDCEDNKATLPVTETLGELSEQENSQSKNKLRAPCTEDDISSISCEPPNHKLEDRC